MPDAQAGHEKTLTGLLAALSGANLIYGPGMLDSGLIFSFSQLVIDNEIIKMIRKVMQGISVDDDSLAIDIIKEVGPRGDFLLQEHTIKHMRNLPSYSMLIDRRKREHWLELGSKDMADRAAEKAKEIMQKHKALPLSNQAISEIRAIVNDADAEYAERRNRRNSTV